MINNKGIIFLAVTFGVFFSIVLSSFVTAAGATITSAGVLNPDIFFSSGDGVVNISVNITNASVIGVYANFSNISTSACGSGILNLTYNSSRGLWIGNCSIASFINDTTPSSKTIGIAVYNASYPSEILNLSSIAILTHNLGVPAMSGGGCEQFGPLTTNFSNVLDFAHVNFVINVQLNLSCISNGGVASPTFKDALILNLTSVNLSSQQQAAQLMQLQSAMVVNITPPRQFGSSYIYIDTSAFAALDSNATIWLIDLPFAARPNISADNSGKLNSTSINWTSNGFNSLMNVSTGNLTFSVAGFSGYNVSDIIAPKININTPVANTNSTSGLVVINVSVNGTGTEPSSISIYLDGATNWIYNSTFNSANCSNYTQTGEIYNCFFATNASDGNHNVSVVAYDYGGSAGNFATNSSLFSIDTVAPTISVFNPSNVSYIANQSIIVYFTSSESGTKWFNYNGTSNTTYTVPINISYTGLGVKNITFYANDSFGNLARTNFSFLIIGLPANTTLATNQSSIEANENTSAIVVAYNSTLQNVSVPATLANQSISLDLSQLLRDGNVTLGSNNFSLVRMGAYNYTAYIPSNINVTGGAGWDGIIRLPIVNSTAFTAPSSGTTNITISVGSSVELNFSSPVKIIIGGMAGMRAAWARGGTTLTNIATVCNSETAPTNINNVSTRECYMSSGSGSDLVIWTYHFTDFAAYTPESTTTEDDDAPASSSGGSTTPSYWLNTYEYADSEFINKNPITKLFAERSLVKLKIGGETHSVGILEIYNTMAIINVSSIPQQATLAIGEMKKFDVNSDNIYELSVKVNSVVNADVNLTISPMNESVGNLTLAASNATQNSTNLTVTPGSQGGAGTAGTGESAVGNNSSTKWIVLVIIIVVLIGLIVLFLKTKKVDYNPQKHRH